MAIIPVPEKFSFTELPTFVLDRAGNALRSKYTGAGQRVVFPYAVWSLAGKLVEYDGLDAGKIRSFLVQLEGQANTFRMPVPGFTKPMTGYNGNATSNGATAARASSIVVDGLTASVPVVAEGDYITINDELKLVTQAGASNGAGQMTISFKPPLRKPVADNTTVYLQNPWCLMCSPNDDVAKWGVAPPIRQKTSFEAIEAVEI